MALRLRLEAFAALRTLAGCVRPELRRKLLPMTAGRQFRDSAPRVLREIDRVRDESDTPENETLHPDPAFGKPWPIFVPDPDVEDSG
ncbi:hypothetical protein [Ensifer sp. ENS10]|uniref:hypothetical protein n=1 Tax=Ensifer sp. ENS10 TaxID=2769286 RepID=UPI0035C82DB5